MSLCTIICIGTLALCKGSGYGEYQLTISRDGYDLDEESIKEIAYFNDEFLEITDKAESGDLIYVQVINKRDPQVKSDIIEITIY